MMTNSPRRWIGALLFLEVCILLPASSLAQNRPRSAPQQQTGRTVRTADERTEKPQRPERAVANDPRLEAFLQNWEKFTKNIKTLEGRHTRFTYDFTWKVEKRAVGAFYYAAPDRGRIDLLPDERIKKGETKEVNGTTFQVQPADPEMWISNGQEIIQVNVKDETFSRMPLPPNLKGQNIMDGPLPFLFGMPADIAKTRYDMELLKVDEKNRTVLIKVKPLWPADAANYSEALLIINTATYLPNAVKLVHPGGNEETVYSFGELDVNKEPKIFEFVLGKKDPFNPSLRGYSEMQNAEQLRARPQQPQGDEGVRPAGGEQEQPAPPRLKPGTVPNLQGMNHTKIEELLTSLGYKVKFYKGKPAPEKDFIYTAYNQIPQPGEPLKPGEVVKVQLFNEVGAAGK